MRSFVFSPASILRTKPDVSIVLDIGGFVADLLNLLNIIQIYSNMNNFEYADVFDKQAIS